MKIPVSILLLFCLTIGSAQVDRCGIDWVEKERWENATQEEIRVRDENQEVFRKAVQRVQQNSSRSTFDYVIPVVVHVFHDDGHGNISDEQVKDGLRMANEDFQRLNKDTTETRDVFKKHAGVANFEFRLAKKDPNGQPTNGIIRINSSMTNSANDAIKSLSRWPIDKYFNIWLVNEIHLNSSTSTLGYAYYPTMGTNLNYGIVVRNNKWGEIGTAGAGDRTGTHEFGHSFNLRHTFDSGCGSECDNSGDLVCDTPPVSQASWSCSDQQNTCFNDVASSGSETTNPFETNVVDQIENYMSYNSCQNMFSKGQVERMVASLQTYSTLINLVSSENLAFTGVDQLCEADFEVDDQIVCLGQGVCFKDRSTYGASKWNWSFPKAYPASSVQRNQVVTYLEPGLHNVALDVANNANVTKTTSKEGYMFVTDPLQNYPPYFEDFEDHSALPNNEWFVNNISHDSFTFELENSVGYSGNSSVKMDNYLYNSLSAKDELISGAMDLSALKNVTVSFKTAYAEFPDAMGEDRLWVYVSNNCGDSWKLKRILIESEMGKAQSSTTAYIPSDTSEWVTHFIDDIGSNYLVEGFMLKFVSESGRGNILYLDDISVAGEFNPIPVLHKPDDGSMNVADNELINWKSVQGVDEYEFEIDTDLSFNTPNLIAGFREYTDADPNGHDTQYQLDNLMHGTTYYWRVRSLTGNVRSGWSDAWQFTVSDNGVGIHDFGHANQYKLYPNPASESFKVENIEKGSVIRVFNTLGQNITTVRAKGSAQKFNVSNWDPGIYIIDVNGKKKRVLVN